jgi:hypothetical protein
MENRHDDSRPFAAPQGRETFAMNRVVDIVILVAGALTALGIALACGVGLFVWLAGGRNGEPTEAWRSADER